jgi:hypothetical protein
MERMRFTATTVSGPRGRLLVAVPDDPDQLWAEAAAFFDTLPQFYTKAYLRWIDSTSRRPDVRAQRIDDVVQWLAAGLKQRPKP